MISKTIKSIYLIYRMELCIKHIGGWINTYQEVLNIKITEKSALTATMTKASQKLEST